MVSSGGFSLRMWLQMQIAFIANWLCEPEHLYWAKPDAWEDYLRQEGAYEVDTGDDIAEGSVEMWVEMDMGTWRRIDDLAADYGTTHEDFTAKLIEERIEQLEAGHLDLGDQSQVVMRWRNISKALAGFDHSQIETQIAMGGIYLPWSDIAVMDAIVLGDKHGE